MNVVRFLPHKMWAKTIGSASLLLSSWLRHSPSLVEHSITELNTIEFLQRFLINVENIYKYISRNLKRFKGKEISTATFIFFLSLWNQQRNLSHSNHGPFFDNVMRIGEKWKLILRLKNNYFAHPNLFIKVPTKIYNFF